MKFKRFAFLLTVVAAIVVSVSACGSEGPQTVAARGLQEPQFTPQPNVRYFNHWISPSALDTMSPDGTFVRAYIEAFDRAQLSLTGRDRTYPGFRAAHRAKNTIAGTDKIFAGTVTFWVPIKTVGARGSVEALICELDNVASPEMKSDFSLNAMRLTYVRTGESPPAAQSGTAWGPSTSMFGGWYTTRYDETVNGEPNMSRAEIDRRLQPCTASMQKPDERPTPTPGWPLAGASR